MKITFSWDDGAPEDIKLFRMHERFCLPGMFFVPNRNQEGLEVISGQTIRAASSSLIRFGAHTASHVRLSKLPDERIKEELYDNQCFLEDALGMEVRHFCLPGGEYNRRVLDAAFSRFDTVRTADTMNFMPGSRLIRPTFHIYPRGIRSLLANGIRNRSFWAVTEILSQRNHPSYFQTMRILLDQAANREAAQVILWGHSWEIEKLGLWEELEGFFHLIGEKYRSQCVRYEELTAGGRE